MTVTSCSSAPALPTATAPQTTDVAGVQGGGLTAPAPAAAPDLATAVANLSTAVGALQTAIAGSGLLTPAGDPGAVAGGGGAASGCGCGQAGGGAAEIQQGTPEQFNAAPAEPAAPPAAPAPAPAPAPAAAPGQAPKGFKIQHPLEGGAKVTSHFGEISSIRNGRPHGGTDLGKGSGTPIHAAAPGTIAEVGWDPDGYGNYVTIDHGNGWFTRYAHMVEKPSVAKGDKVDVGKQIGKVGSTGNSTGPHLHFEVLKGGTGASNRQDAEPFLEGKKTLD